MPSGEGLLVVFRFGSEASVSCLSFECHKCVVLLEGISWCFILSYSIACWTRDNTLDITGLYRFQESCVCSIATFVWRIEPKATKETMLKKINNLRIVFKKELNKSQTLTKIWHGYRQNLPAETVVLQWNIFPQRPRRSFCRKIQPGTGEGRPGKPIKQQLYDENHLLKTG